MTERVLRDTLTGLAGREAASCVTSVSLEPPLVSFCALGRARQRCQGVDGAPALSTTMRYVHHRPRHEVAATLERHFTGAAAELDELLGAPSSATISTAAALPEATP